MICRENNLLRGGTTLNGRRHSNVSPTIAFAEHFSSQHVDLRGHRGCHNVFLQSTPSLIQHDCDIEFVKPPSAVGF